MEFEENTMLLSLDPSGIDICGNEKVTIASDGLVKVFNETKSTTVKSNGIEISGNNTVKLTDTGIDICDNFAISYNELSFLDGVSSNIQQQLNNNAITPATSTTLGGIKVGNNLSINGEGVLSSSTTGTDVLNAGAVMTTGNQNINGNKNFVERVGIGGENTTTSQLYVNSTNTALHITQPDNGERDSIKFHRNDVDYYGGIGFKNGLNITTPNANFPISLATNNTERIKIGGNGNVGIGSANPAYTLDVSGDLNFTGTIKKNGADFFGGFWSTNSDKLYYNTDNVGIGSANPATKLTVQGPTATGTTGSSAIQYGDDNGSQYLFAGANHGGILSSSGNGLYMQQSSGNVNIGGTSFNEKLEVTGNAIVSGSVKVNGTKEVATKEYVDGQFTTTNANVTTNTNTINTKGLWDKNGDKIYYNTDNIGIGTNDPGSKLEVVGDISASGVVKSNGGKTVATQDYVDGKIDTLVGDPNLDTALDTLKEIADAINGDAGFGTMVQTKFNSIDASFTATENATATNTTNIANNTSNISSNISDIVDLKNKVNILNKTIETFNVTVAAKTTSHPYYGQGSTSGYYLNGIESPELRFKVGSTYTFTVTDQTTNGHPFGFYLDAARTTPYTTNVTDPSSSNVSIQITETTPSKLYYQCGNHGYMGNCVSVGLERSDVTQQEVGYLSGTSSNIQTQLDSKVSSQWTTNGSNEIYFAENVGIGTSDPTTKLEVIGDISAGGNIFGRDIKGTHVYIGNRNVISGSAQGSFTDLELKNGSTHKILGHGDTGNIEMAGVLQVDTINEFTDTSGVTIDNLLIKDGGIDASGTIEAHTVKASHFNVGSRNIVSASAQGSFTDLEVKGQNGHLALLVNGSDGDSTLDGSLNIKGILNVKNKIGVSFENPTTKISLGNDNYDPNNVKDKMISLHDNANYYYSIGMAGDTTNDAGVGIWSKVEPTKSNPAMFVKNDGKVGVGNVAPTEHVDVSGNIKASGTITIGTEPTNNNHAATKNYVDGKVAELVDSAPEALNTLSELSAALNDDVSFGTVINNKFSGVDSSINDLRTTVTNSLINNTVTLYRPGDMRLTHDKANVKDFKWFREDDSRSSGNYQIARSITDDNPVLGGDNSWANGRGYYSSSEFNSIFTTGNPGSYTGSGSTTVDGVAKAGIWFEWEFFEKVKANRFRISTNGARLYGGYDGAPTYITIAGSNDGSTWYSVNNEETLTKSDYDDGTATIAGTTNIKISKFAERDLDPSKIASYKFYRLIIRGRINDTDGNNDNSHRLFIGEFELIGSVVFSSNDASLNHITDVDTLSSPPTNGQALVWDNTAGMWKPGSVTNTNVISDLNDVNTSGATNNQALVWSSATSEWVPGNTTSAINDLTDVNTSGASSGQSLIWNGSTWTPGLGGAFSKNGTNAYYNSGNVGIGTTTPSTRLFINGLWNNLLSIKGNGTTEKEMRFFSGSGYCAIAVNSSNTEAITFRHDTTNVGIGENNPSEKLDVNGIILGGNARIGNATMNSSYASYGHKSLTGNNQYALIQTNSGSTRLNASTGQILDFRVDNDVKMTVAANGNVGIGFTTPSYKLSLGTSWNSDPNKARIALYEGSSSYSGKYFYGLGIIHPSGEQPGLALWGGTDNSLPDNSNVTLTANRLGNVGIGTTNPSEKLDVAGNIKASGSIEGNTIKVASLDSTANHNKVLMINSSGEIDICSNVASSGGGGGGGGAWSEGSNNKLYYNAGNVGIGTSDPTEKLQVNGKILAASMKFTSLVADTNTGASTAVWEGSGNDVILSSSGNVGIGTTNPSAKLDVNGGIQISGHILPSSNAQYDIGSAEYKIRHLFLSDNSLWIGDKHKVSIADGKIKFRKRKVNQIPQSIAGAGGNFNGAAAHLLSHGFGNFTNPNELKLEHWLEYAKSLNVAGKGVGNAEIGDLYNDNLADFDEDIDAGYVLPAATDSALGGVKQGSGITIAGDGTISAVATNMWTEIAGNHIYRSSGNVGIGSASPGEKLDVVGNIKTSGTLILGTEPTNSNHAATKNYVDSKPTTFLGLTDTPASLTASKYLAVNSGGNAIEFVDAPAGGGGGSTIVVAKQSEMRVSHDKANVKEFTHYEPDANNSIVDAENITDDKTNITGNQGWHTNNMFYSREVYTNSSGGYTGTASTTFSQNPQYTNYSGGTYTGTWFQWQFFEKVKVSELRIAGNANSDDKGRNPKMARLVASNDGSNWYSLGDEIEFGINDFYRSANVGGSTVASGKFAERTIQAPNSYNYYRLIINAIHRNGTDSPYNISDRKQVAISEVELIGKVMVEQAGVTNIIKGQTLETIAGVCDGRTIEAISGTYTLPAVTQPQECADGSAWTELTGSKISYKPPSGTKQVIYKLHIHMSGTEFGNGTNSFSFISSMRIKLDNTTITNFDYHEGGENHIDSVVVLTAIFDIGSEDNVTDAKLLSWNSNKEIKIEVTSYPWPPRTTMYHSAQLRNDNGSYTNGHSENIETIQVIKPRMEIKAIGEKTTVNSFVPHDGMTIQTQHKDYKKKVAKDSGDWDPIDDDLDTGFVVKIEPTSANSKVMISTISHIGYKGSGVLNSSGDAEWWGARLYRKIGSGAWLQVTEANGDNTSTTLGGSSTTHPGTSCWFCNSQGAGAGHEDYGIGNCAASFLDSPNTTDTIYYTIYWKSALGSSTYNAPLYLNRGHIHNTEIRPSPMSSITASEIWSSGSPYIPPTDGVISVYNSKIGIDNSTPSYDLDVSGNINFTGTLYQDGVEFSGGGSSVWSEAASWVESSSNKGVKIQGSTGVIPANESPEILFLTSYGSPWATNTSTNPAVDQWYAAWNDNLTGISDTTETGFSLWAEHSIKALRLYQPSDIRIKRDISMVDDNEALTIVNNIEAMKYNYKDIRNMRQTKTYGFLAQNVREHLPNAVSLQTEYIPDITKHCYDCSWNQTESGNWKVTLAEPIDISSNMTGNVKIFAYNISDISNSTLNENSTAELNVKIEDDNQSFILDKKYEHIFIFGREINDFHFLDKEQVFAVHHSAIQELSRKNDTLQTENNELRSRLEALESAVLALQNNN